MTKEIELTQGKVAIVDDDDFDQLNSQKWHAMNNTGKRWYAGRSDAGTTLLMHRFIMHALKDFQVDHINGNGLDNRKSNLRLCLPKENQCNRGAQKNNKVGYKGVSNFRGKFRADISHDKESFYLGSFASPIDAAHAYDKKARELFGEFAKLNFPLIGN